MTTTLTSGGTELGPKPTPTIDDVVGGFVDVPTLAPVAIRVIEMMDDDEVSISELTDLVGRDPGLAARLLRLVNSAAYSRGKEVTNLNRAALLLGLRTLKMVALSFSVMSERSVGGLDCSMIWRRSLTTGVLARRLAAGTDEELVDEAFVAGLLSNIGKIALVAVPAYTEAIAADGPWMAPERERQVLGFGSDEVTAGILGAWELPDILVEAVATRARRGTDEPPTLLGAMLQVADHAAVLLLADGDERAHALDAMTFSAANHLGKTVGEIEAIIEAAGPELDELAGSFDLGTITPASMEEVLRSAQAKLAQLSLDVATQLSEEQQRVEALEQSNEELSAAASTDALTGLPNRRTFDAFLASQVASRQRRHHGQALGLIVFDLDHFKHVNDTHGHAVGDEVLRTVGERLLSSSRREELAARIGGEEFAIVLPEVGATEIAAAAERIRELVGDAPMETSIGPLEITASVGASLGQQPDDELATRLYETADTALYASKEAGRNRVTINRTS